MAHTYLSSEPQVPSFSLSNCTIDKLTITWTKYNSSLSAFSLLGLPHYDFSSKIINFVLTPMFEPL